MRPVASEVSSSAGWREAGKQARRARIVAAASALVRVQGFDAVTMTAIAAQAGVSPATLYNLFATKAAIFREVFDDDLETFAERLAALPSPSAIARLFAALELAGELYARDPVFYRALAMHGGRGASLRPAIREPRMAFWQAQVAAAIADGGLVPGCDPRLAGTALAHLFSGVFQDWAAEVVSAPRLVLEASYGFALILRPFATPASVAALEARITALAGALAAGPRSGVQPALPDL